MECIRFIQQLCLTVFIFLAVMGRLSFSHARQVKDGATAVATVKKSVAKGDHSTLICSQKEISLDAVIHPSALGGRKTKTDQNTINYAAKEMKKVTVLASSSSTASAATHCAPSKRKISKRSYEEMYLKDNFVAFSADYRSPKPHPPRNN